MAFPIVHVELIGPDPQRLRDFYGPLFGWNAPPGSPVAERISLASEYSFLEPDDDAPPVAGGIGGGEGFTAHAIFYVGVESVEWTLAEAERLGGAIALPPQRNTAGGVIVGHFRDPAGNLVGVAGPL